METKTRLLNVDLFLASSQGLTPLLEAFSKKVDVLGHWRLRGKNWANLEVIFGPPGTPRTVVPAIRRFVKLVDKLPPRARRLWSSAAVRDFNVGVQSGTKEGATFVVDTSLLKEIARVGARLVFTIYRADMRQLDAGTLRRKRSSA